MPTTLRTAPLAVLVLLVLPAAAAPDEPSPEDRPDTPRVLTAAPAEGSIAVDGRLDEAAWAGAEVATGFLQLEPDEGDPASQPTEVRVLYGPAALYVGAVLHDDPARVRRPLSRRDDAGDADLFLVGIDGFAEGRTAYLFAVTAAGVQLDAVQDGGDNDFSWDAVWDSAVRLTPEGWAVELAIPYSMLRFPEGREQAWGVQFQRKISRNEEDAFWQPITQEETGIGFIAGQLVGLRGIAPRANVQVRPYVLAQADRRPEDGLEPSYTGDTGLDAGADVKVGISSNVILDVTLNPDFGQVEADPAILNLSAFEQFFPERRPFFLEGTGIFDYVFGNGPLLYTRRIGSFGPIVGASKLTGRTRDGLSFGVLGAVTGDGAVVRDGAVAFPGDDFEPDTYYAAGRLKREFGNRSFVGAAATYYDDNWFLSSDDPALRGRFRTLAGGLDWDYRPGSGTYQWEGAVTGSYRQFDDVIGRDDRGGFGLWTGFDKIRGVVTGGLGVRVYSPEFELNDVGFLRENDLVQLDGGGEVLFNGGEPFGPFRLARGYSYQSSQWGYDDRAFRGTNVSWGTWWYLKGFQRVGLRGSFANLFGGDDVFESRGLGPVDGRTGFGVTAEFTTDTRRRFVFTVEPGGGFFQDGGAAWDLELYADWTVSDRLTLSFEGEYEQRDNIRSWVANEAIRQNADGFFLGCNPVRPGSPSPNAPFDDERTLENGTSVVEPCAPFNPGAELAGFTPFSEAGGARDYYVSVFGARDQREVNAMLRAGYTLRPDLSFQLYSQLFAARARFQRPRLLAGPDDLRPFDTYPRRREETVRSLQFNAVARWEYRPGSTVFVVWTHNRFNSPYSYYFAGPGVESPYDRDTFGLALDTFDILPTNVFLIKLNYLLMR